MYKYSITTYLIISLLISGCGFQLRGNIDLPSELKQIAVVSENYSDLVNNLNQSLSNSDIQVVNKSDKNLYRVKIISEVFNRRQLSINISGRVNEYELIYNVTYQISSPDKKSKQETLSLYRDYSFDENNIMGNTDREAQIRREMVSNAASLIFTKLITRIKNTDL
tara:strand:- start:120 stop:617 length:498 start_codon:yes stop_codon:yes gene_type:complete